MKQVIYKYPMPMDKSEITLPTGAHLLGVQVQHEAPQLWVLLNPEEIHMDTWEIYVIGTGHIHDDLDGFEYLSSFQLLSGFFIGHVFTRNMADPT